MKKRIVLASASPRRRQLLAQVGIPHEVIVSNANEDVTGTPPEQVMEVALRKAFAVQAMLEVDDAIIIAADTLVSIDGEVLGKPADSTEAFAMLKKLQGATHVVLTGVVIVANGERNVMVDAAEVTFRKLTDEDINAYIATGEPFDKAGAYGIQEVGSVLVERIHGDFYTVMGLPIAKVCAALVSMGYDFWGNRL